MVEVRKVEWEVGATAAEVEIGVVEVTAQEEVVGPTIEAAPNSQECRQRGMDMLHFEGHFQ